MKYNLPNWGVGIFPPSSTCPIFDPGPFYEIKFNIGGCLPVAFFYTPSKAIGIHPSLSLSKYVDANIYLQDRARIGSSAIPSSRCTPCQRT